MLIMVSAAEGLILDSQGNHTAEQIVRDQRCPAEDGQVQLHHHYLFPSVVSQSKRKQESHVNVQLLPSHRGSKNLYFGVEEKSKQTWKQETLLVVMSGISSPENGHVVKRLHELFLKCMSLRCLCEVDIPKFKTHKESKLNAFR